MRSLPLPTDPLGNEYLADGVYKLCVSCVRDADLKRKLRSVTRLVKTAAAEYEQAAQNEELHLFPRTDGLGRNLSSAEMTDVYEKRFVKLAVPRVIYDRIFRGAENGRCPLCDAADAATLDHHLPKGYYSSLVVTPANLVPACDRCQNSKFESYPLVAEDQTFHPYFDNFEDEQWLAAEVIETSPAAFRFYVEPPSGWTQLRTSRAKSHLRIMGLYALYSTNAADELTEIRGRLRGLHASGGVAAVKGHLEEEAKSRRENKLNSWRTAMYQAASLSQWFCDLGFAGT